MSDPNYVENLRQLEAAANAVLAAPNAVSAQHRREAESLFIKLQTNPLPMEFCRYVLESTSNQLVMFEISKALVNSMLKQWNRVAAGNEKEVEGAVVYLCNFCASRSGLPSYVITKVLQSAAMITKRASLETQILQPESLLVETVGAWLSASDNDRLQALGLQLVEALASEFSSTWGRASVGASVSWDFHTRAKRRFEQVLLKWLMETSIASLSRLFAQGSIDLSTSPSHTSICDNFLRVALLVLSWNFAPKLHDLRLRMLVSSLKTNSFRPPTSWSELFHDASIVTFFMQLHFKVRTIEALSANSMGCLAQLASTVGDILCGSVEDLPRNLQQQMRINAMVGGTDADALGNDSRQETAGGLQIHDLYLQKFSSALIELFSPGILDHEMLPLSIVLYKLFTYHPISIFKRFPGDMLNQLVNFISATILRLSGPAMELALLKNDQFYHEALHNLYQVWRTLLRASAIFPDPIAGLIHDQTALIIRDFLSTIFSPPYGRRGGDLAANNAAMAAEITEENEEEEDDREVFADLLSDLGHMYLFRVDFSCRLLNEVLANKLNSMGQLLVAGGSPLTTWQEDMHWLLLIVGNCLQQSSYDAVSHLPEELARHCIAGYASGAYNAPANFEHLLNECLTNPMGIDPMTVERMDPATQLFALLFKWFMMEHNAFSQLSGDGAGTTDGRLSPELARTSLWLYGIVAGVLVPKNADRDEVSTGFGAHDEDADEAAMLKFVEHLPHIPCTGSQLASQVVELALGKVFMTLSRMPGEEKLCSQAIHLIITLAESRAEVLAAGDHLYALLSHVELERLPARRQLIKALVLVWAAASGEEIRQRIYSAIFQPLQAKFVALCENAKSLASGELDSKLADLYECFSGVADGGQSEVASSLFTFLHPMFQASAPLLRQRADSQLVVNAVLEFIRTTSDALFFYVEENEQCSFFHSVLLAIAEAYRDRRLKNFHSRAAKVGGEANAAEEEQQMGDLVALIDILCHSVSKTYMPTYDGAGSVENSAKVAILGLEFLMPLMSAELLQVPTVCAAFFRLLLFISDLAPGTLAEAQNTQMVQDFVRCVRMGLANHFGVEYLRPCLEIVNNMAAHLCACVPGAATSSLIANQIAATIDVVFPACLEYSCEVEIYNEASNALYALINLDSANFARYVHTLVAREENAGNREQIEQAFQELVPLAMQQQTQEINRQERRLFHDRLDKFLTQINGLLCL